MVYEVIHTSHCNNMISNTKLTEEERETKRRLKAELKHQRRVKSLETKIKHAISRKDAVIEKSAREELKTLLESKNDTIQISQQLSQWSLNPPINDTKHKAAVDDVIVILRKLLSSIDDEDRQTVKKDKIEQTMKARTLLSNMTKGSQTKSMLKDITALRGYTRQKFHGRATLLIESFANITPESLELAPTIYSRLDTQQQQECIDQMEIMNMCYEKLDNIQRVCSLGCGPGNDAAGLVAFLRSFMNRKDALEEIVLLDYAIEDWQEAVLDDLTPILVPGYISKITCESCDVTRSIKSDIVEQYIRDSDIFLTSYLLTETRNKWAEFIIELIDLSKVGAMFYFAEPVPWQLHQVIRMSTNQSEKSTDIDYLPLNKLRFAWIDSSIHQPLFQKLDGRPAGPAILLAIKVDKTCT